MSKESIQGPLSALRNAGTVAGVCLTRGSELLVNLFPYSEARVGDMAMALDDIQSYFSQQHRSVDQMSFGYDGGCVTLVEDGEFRLIVMHMLAEEVDFIAKAARAFLADFQLNLFAEQIVAGNPRLEGVVTREPDGLFSRAPAKRSEVGEALRAAAGPETAEGEVPSSDDQPAESTQIPEADGSDEQREPDLRELPGPPPSVARLAEHQPDSTLPPPRRPKKRG